jgi:hypothetical protein
MRESYRGRAHSDEGEVYLNGPRAIDRHLRYDLEPEGFYSNGVRFILCERRSRLVLGHFHLARVPIELDAASCEWTVCDVVHELALPTRGAVLIVLMRPGPFVLLPGDRRWYRAARRVCQSHAVPLLGVHLVTPRAQREVAVDEAM